MKRTFWVVAYTIRTDIGDGPSYKDFNRVFERKRDAEEFWLLLRIDCIDGVPLKWADTVYYWAAGKIAFGSDH